MKKYFLITVLLLFIVISSACSGEIIPAEDPGMTGYVMQKDNNRILVIDSKPQDFSSSGGVSEFYNAIWFSNSPDEVKIGDKVAVWFDAVAESYPGQSEAIYVEIIDSIKPGDAILTEAQALNRALEARGNGSAAALQSIYYNSDQKQWEVSLKEILSEDAAVVEVIVPDQF